MLIRLVLAILLLAVGAAGVALLQRLRLSKVAKTAGADPLLSNLRAGLPTILYFTTPDCMTCKYAQGPALEQLQNEVGDAVNIVKVDATEDVDAARRWKIQTVPTTYVLDASLKPVEVNQGAADVSRLRAQLASASYIQAESVLN